MVAQKIQVATLGLQVLLLQMAQEIEQSPSPQDLYLSSPQGLGTSKCHLTPHAIAT
jgi:hypothetical protein